MRKPLLLLAAVAAMASCHRPKSYQSFRPVPAHTWSRTDTAVFLVPAAEEPIVRDLRVSLRLGRLFPYSEVYLLVERMMQDSAALPVRDTVCVPVTDTLEPLRSDGLNLVCRQSAPVPLPQPAGQDCEIRVTHLMHRDPLPHVSDVGILLSVPYDYSGQHVVCGNGKTCQGQRGCRKACLENPLVDK